MLPSEAPMPPCAATVCERVGNTLDRHATFSPACARRSEACMPEPPAPTMTTSNLRFARLAMLFLESPEHLDRPAATADEPCDGEYLQRQAGAQRLDVVHPDIAHAHPGVPGQRDDGDEGQHLHPLRREDLRP